MIGCVYPSRNRRLMGHRYVTWIRWWIWDLIHDLISAWNLWWWPIDQVVVSAHCAPLSFDSRNSWNRVIIANFEGLRCCPETIVSLVPLIVDVTSGFRVAVRNWCIWGRACDRRVTVPSISISPFLGWFFPCWQWGLMQWGLMGGWWIFPWGCPWDCPWNGRILWRGSWGTQGVQWSGRCSICCCPCVWWWLWRKCVGVGGRWRVRMASPGYSSWTSSSDLTDISLLNSHRWKGNEVFHKL